MRIFRILPFLFLIFVGTPGMASSDALSPSAGSSKSLSLSAGLKVKAVKATLSSSPASVGPATHRGLGQIIELEEKGKVLLLKHKAFKDGFMGAMEMPFELSDAKLSEGLKAGDKVNFTLQAHDDDFWIVSISKTAK